MRCTASIFADLAQLQIRRAQQAVAHSINRASPRRALHLLQWRNEFGPTARAGHPGEHLHHHGHRKFQQPESRRHFQVNGEIVRITCSRVGEQ
jgi:hypothetical protein